MRQQGARRGARRPCLARLLQGLLLGAHAAAVASAAAAAGARRRLHQTPAGSTWRWQLLQTPDKAPEFNFRRRRRSAPGEALPEWWTQKDREFEEEGVFCHGRWLGVQVLQSPEDLLYLQQVLTRLRPHIVVETGTYRGGLAFYAASVLSQLGLDHAKVITMDTFAVANNFHNLDNHALCPVCRDCIKAYETDLWRKHVVFFEGNTLKLHDQVRRLIGDIRRREGDLGPVLVSLDAQHSYDGTLLELHYYGPLVSVGSYLVLQDARLDDTYGRAGPYSAGVRLISDGAFPNGAPQWVWDRDVEVFGYTQHLWLRRDAHGPPVGLMFEADDEDLISWSPFSQIAEEGVCDGSEEGALEEVPGLPSWLECKAVCIRVPDELCRFFSYAPEGGRCLLRQDCPRLRHVTGAVAHGRTG